MPTRGEHSTAVGGARGVGHQAVVLLVQPDDDSRQMYAEFLRYHGCRTIFASDAAEAEHVAPGVDIVVTGILLNGTADGIDLVARLRSDERTKNSPIIVLTACAWQTERERAEQVGCDVFLPKPCLPDHLLREIRRLLATSTLRHVQRGRPAKAHSATKSGDKKKRTAKRST